MYPVDFRSENESTRAKDLAPPTLFSIPEKPRVMLRLLRASHVRWFRGAQGEGHGERDVCGNKLFARRPQVFAELLFLRLAARAYCIPV